MGKLRCLGNEAPSDWIVANIISHSLKRAIVESLNFREAFLPNRSPEPQLPSSSKRKPAFDELHRSLDGQITTHRE